MGEVAAVIRVMPESPEIDLEALKTSIQNVVAENEFQSIEEDPVAFGLVALNVTIVVDDGEGGTEPAEKAIAELDGVQNVEVTDVGRLM